MTSRADAECVRRARASKVDAYRDQLPFRERSEGDPQIKAPPSRGEGDAPLAEVGRVRTVEASRATRAYWEPSRFSYSRVSRERCLTVIACSRANCSSVGTDAASSS